MGIIYKNGIKYGGGDSYIVEDKSLIPVIGTQTSSTGSWTGNIDIPHLYNGLTIAYFLPYAPSGNATLNLTLSDGSTTGPINCYYNTGRLTTHYAKGSNIIMTFWGAGSISVDGTATTDDRWVVSADYNSNTDTWRNIQVNGTQKLGTATNTGALNFKDGENTSVSYDGGVKVDAIDTTYDFSAGSSIGYFKVEDNNGEEEEITPYYEVNTDQTSVLPLAFTAKGGTAVDWAIEGNDDNGTESLLELVQLVSTTGTIATSIVSDGVTFTKNDDSVVLSNQSTATYPQVFLNSVVGQNCPKLEKGKTYSAKIFVDNKPANASIYLQIKAKNQTDVIWKGGVVGSINESGATLTISQDWDIWGYLLVAQGNNISYQNTNVKVCIVEGSTAPDHYIPYQQGVGERTRNLIPPIRTANGWKQGYRQKNNGNYTSGHAYGEWLYDSYIPIDSTSFTFWATSVSGQASGTFYFFDNNKDYLTNTAIDINNYNDAIISSLPPDAAYMQIAFRTYCMSEQEIIDNNYQVMLVKGSTAPDHYIPYGYQVPISVNNTPQTFYIGNSPLTAGQSISKTSTGVDIELFNGENTVSTTLYNKPEMTINYLHQVDIDPYINSKIPTALKNPYALTINYNTTKSFDYDGSTAKSLSIKAGDNITLSGDTNGNITINGTANTWTALVGATSSSNGSVGYINAIPPKEGYNTKFFRADGTWAIPDYIPNTDEKVKQTNNTNNSSYRILLSNSANDTEETNGVKKSAYLLFNPNSKTLTTTNLSITKINNVAVGSTPKFTDTTYTLSTGDSNGQIKVTPSNGNAYNVDVKGLGSNAYSSTAYLPLTGGTVTGAINIKSSNLDRNGEAPTDDQTGKSLYFVDKDDNGVGRIYTVQRKTNNKKDLFMSVYNASGTSNSIGIRILDDGTPSYYLSSPSAFRDTLDNAAYIGANTITSSQVIIADGTDGKLKSSGYTINKSVPSDAVFTDTKNTAGSTDTSSKIFLIGATSQAANPQTYSDSQVYVTSGSLFLTKNQDASGTADNKPALLIGNPTEAHLEFDTNEIMAKATDTTTGPLYLNNDGGLVYANNKKVVRLTSDPTSGQVMIADGTDGQIKSSGYTIKKSVPSDAVFTDTDEKVKTNLIVTEGDEFPIYYFTATGNTNESAKQLYVNDNVRIRIQTGTASTTGRVRMMLGNNIAEGTADNCCGQLQLYSTDSGFSVLRQATGVSSSGITIYLPPKSGTIFNTGSLVAGDNITLTESNGVYSINGTANTDTKVTVTETDPTTKTTYYPVWRGSHSTGTGGVLVNEDFKYNSQLGTASAVGQATIVLGNSTNSGTAGNKFGQIILFAEKSGYTVLKYKASSTSDTTQTFPDTTGTVLNTGTTSISRHLTSGTKIATLTINGTDTDLYCQTNTDTHRPIKLKGNSYLGNSSTAVDFLQGSNITLTGGTGDNIGKITIAATNNKTSQTEWNDAGGTNKPLLMGNGFSDSTAGTYYIDNLYCSGSGVLHCQSCIEGSDKRLKDNIEILDNRYLELIKKLQPRRYKFKNDIENKYHIGFITQEIETELSKCNLTKEDFGTLTETGEDKMQGLAYTDFIPMLLLYIKDLEKQIKEIKEQQ